MFTTVALPAATPVSALVGKLYIHKITIQAATPTIVTAYDSASTTITWSRPTYTRRTITGAQTATVTQQDCCGSPSVNITNTGATDVAATVAAAPTDPLPVIASTPEGCCCEIGGLVVMKGLTLVSTAAATAIIEWSTNLP